MHKFTLLLLTTLLTSCGMSNEEIIKQTKLCEAAGMYPAQVINGFTVSVDKIICMPQDKNHDTP